MPFDLSNRVLGQILVDFGDHKGPDVGVKGLSQIGERFWRSHHYESRCFPRPHHLLHCGCNLPGEPVLFHMMPVGRLDRAPLRRVKCLAYPPRSLAPLLMSQRIFILEQPLGLEVWKFLVTFVAKKQGLAAIADKHECVVRDFQFAHLSAPKVSNGFPGQLS